MESLIQPTTGLTAEESFSISRELRIGNRLGLHARAAAKLVKVAESFKSDIFLANQQDEADAKSLLALLSLGCAYDSNVVVKAAGEDAQAAVAALQEVIEDRFGEE